MLKTGNVWFKGNVTANTKMYIESSTANTDVQYVAKRADTNTQVWLGVGSGGINHGVYSNKLSKWIVYADDSNVYLNGKADNSTKWNGLVDDNATVNTTDTWIPVYASGKVQHTLRKLMTAKTHSDYNNNQSYLATMSCFSWWNGAYNSSNNSNLTYAHQGTIQCKPTNLYSNSTGTTGTVTLSQSAADFNYLEIYYRSNDNYYNMVKVSAPNGKTVWLQSGWIWTTNDGGSIKLKTVAISGTSITRKNYVEHTLNSSSSTATDYIYIIRVDGYK